MDPTWRGARPTACAPSLAAARTGSHRRRRRRKTLGVGARRRNSAAAGTGSRSRRERTLRVRGKRRHSFSHQFFFWSSATNGVPRPQVVRTLFPAPDAWIPRTRVPATTTRPAGSTTWSTAGAAGSGSAGANPAGTTLGRRRTAKRSASIRGGPPYATLTRWWDHAREGEYVP